MKTCSKCGVEKALEEFYLKRGGCCKKCHNHWVREHYKRNVDRIAAQKRKYRERNPDKVATQQRESRRRNAHKHKAYHCKYRKRHADRRKACQRAYDKANVIKKQEYNKRNAGRITAYQRAYRKRDAYGAYFRERYKQNAKMIIARIVLRTKERLKSDSVFRILFSCRARLRNVLKGQMKSGRTFDLIGCTPACLRNHIESQFIDGMSWDNYGQGKGKWHIDHILPCASFDLSKEDQQRLCFHWTNLQPLWGEDNIRKGAKIILPPADPAAA